MAAWIFGGIYYTSLSTHWLAAQGKDAGAVQIRARDRRQVRRRNGSRRSSLVFVAELVIAFVLYGIVFHVGVFTARAGAISGAVCWLGFVLTTVASNNAFTGRRPMLTVIDSGAWLGALLIIGAILGWMGR